MHEILLEQATQLLHAGKVPQAIEAHQRLLALQPKLPDSWYNLGFLHQLAGQYVQALNAYEQALKQGLEDPEEAHLNRAVLLIEKLARPDEGEQVLTRLLARAPHYLPALLNLGNLHEQQGQGAEALDSYQRVLHLHPGHALALARLVNLIPLSGTARSLATRIEAELAKNSLTAAERADLGFALGKALDHAGEFDQAFQAYRQANQASLETAGPRARRYDAASHEQRVDRLMASYPAPPDPVTPANGEPQLIFICGMFRSGSSLVEKILASHPDVTAGGELDLIPQIVQRHATELARLAGPLPESLLQEMRAHYMEGVKHSFPSAQRLTDKRVDNFLHLGLIRTLFPTAIVIHTQRHPIDNCLSLYFLHLTQAMPYATDLTSIGHWYRQYTRLMAHWEKIGGQQFKCIQYDQLVQHPEAVMVDLLKHCGLAWHDACLQFHSSAGTVATPSAWQVRQPLYTRSSGRWKHYERHLAPLLASLGPPQSPSDAQAMHPGS